MVVCTIGLDRVYLFREYAYAMLDADTFDVDGEQGWTYCIQLCT